MFCGYKEMKKLTKIKPKTNHLVIIKRVSE